MDMARRVVVAKDIRQFEYDALPGWRQRPVWALQAGSRVLQKMEVRVLSQGRTPMRTYAQLSCAARASFQGPPASTLAA
jgi:hypothetical protein